MSTNPAASVPRRDIQGLRALAVLAVIGAHAAGWPTGGVMGVDVFFVISGFLITGMLIGQMRRSGRIALGAFYARRARRLLPAALLVLGVTVAVSFVAFNRIRADQTMADAVWAALFASNWNFAAQGTDYFAAAAAVSPLQHFWSLSVEEQFYLVWPGLLALALLVLPARRRLTAAVAGMAVVIGAASFGWALAQTEAQPTLAYFSTLTRAWELAAGALIAVLVPFLRRMPRPLGGALQWAGVAGIAWSIVVIDPEGAGFPAPWAAVAVAATCLVLAGGTTGDPRHRHLFPLTNPAAVFLGDMSYSLYLWHFPVIVFAGVLLPPTGVDLWIELGATAALSLASYLIVEQPLRYAPFLGGMPRPAPSAALASDAVAASGAPGVSGASGASGASDALVGPGASGALDAPVVPGTSLAPGTSGASVAPSVAGPTRPPGWTPGTRYFPGSARPAAHGSAPALRHPQRDQSAALDAPAAPVAAPSSATPAAEPVDRMAAWRERFAGQVFLATAGFVAVVLVGALWATSSGLGPRIGLPAAPAPEAATDPGAPARDPLAALQAELAAAVDADTWPELHPSLDRVMAASSGANPAQGCFSPTSEPDPGSCSWGSADAPVHVYIVGDSTAMAYAPAFRRIADDSDGRIRVTAAGMYGCRFTDVLVENDDPQVMAGCQQRKAAVRGMILADQPDLVVMSNAFTLGHTLDGDDLSAEALIAAQQREAATYGLPGRLLSLAPPPHGVSLSACYTPSSSPKACDSAVDGTWRSMEAASRAAAAKSGDHALSSLPFTCAENVCPPFAGDVPTKYDQTHLTVEFAEHIAPALRQELDALGVLVDH